MSDQITAPASSGDGEAGASDGDSAVPGSGVSRRQLFAIVLAALLVITGVTIALVSQHGAKSVKRPLVSPSSDPNAIRRHALDQLLVERSEGLVNHDRHEFAETLDPDSTAFDEQQLAIFSATAAVPFSSWSYSIDQRGDGRHVASSLSEQLGGQATYSPRSLTEHYEIKGFDKAPSNGSMAAVFVERSGHWFFASLHGSSSPTVPRSVDLWDLGPVRVVRAPHVLVLGPPSELPTMRQLAAIAVQAIPRVNSVWGTDWARRAIFEVPATQHQLALITGATGDLDPIAALSSAEVHTSGRSKPVGSRVAINPANWPKLSEVGRLIVITHELTHVASRTDTDAESPKWLVEGLAEYTGFLNSGVSIQVGAGELTPMIQAGQLPDRLPSETEFTGGAHRLAIAYDEAWLACVTIAADFGQSKLVAFYKAVGTSTSNQAVGDALQHVLHLTLAQFIQRWHRELVLLLG